MATGVRVSEERIERAVAQLEGGGHLVRIARRLKVKPRTLEKWARRRRAKARLGPSGDGKDALGRKLAPGRAPLTPQVVAYLNQARAAGQRGQYFRAHCLAMMALSELAP